MYYIQNVRLEFCVVMKFYNDITSLIVDRSIDTNIKK
jgi:hypothetical protein